MSRPWEVEDVPVTFEHEGYKCHILRGPAGQLNGYVQIPVDHPLHGISYNEGLPQSLMKAWGAAQQGTIGKRSPMDLLMMSLSSEDEAPHTGWLFNVHGGITFAGEAKEGGHLPDVGSFWYGFDCAHAGDFIPKYAYEGDEGVYRDLAYVTAEVKSLATQLKQLEALVL